MLVAISLRPGRRDDGLSLQIGLPTYDVHNERFACSAVSIVVSSPGDFGGKAHR